MFMFIFIFIFFYVCVLLLLRVVDLVQELRSAVLYTLNRIFSANKIYHFSILSKCYQIPLEKL